VASIYDTDENLIGSIEAEAGRVASYDIEGKLLGRFETSPDAVRACFNAWREPLPMNDHDEDMLLQKIKAKLRAGTDD